MLNRQVLNQLSRYRLDGTDSFLSNYEGERKSQQKGQSQEFSDFRVYTPGDDIRLIDWNVYARTDSYQIKLYEEEREARITLVLDHSASMGHHGHKVTLAKDIALMLSYVGLASGDGVRLVTWQGQEGFLATPFYKGMHHYHQVKDLIEKIQWSGQPDFTQVFQQVSFTKGITIWLSDLLYPDFEEIHALGQFYRQHFLVVQLLSEETLSPTVEGMLTLEDSESKGQIEVHCTPAILENYHQALVDHMEGIQDLLSRNGHRYLMLNVDKDDEHHVLKQLLAHGILR